MAQNIVRKEYRNSSKKTRSATSVFYLNTSDKTLLIEAKQHHNDGKINEFIDSTTASTTIGNSSHLKSVSLEKRSILRKSQSSDENSVTSSSSSASLSIPSTVSNASTSTSSSSSFQYNYSVNSTIVGDLDSSKLTSLALTDNNKKPKVPERKRNLVKSKLNLENISNNYLKTVKNISSNNNNYGNKNEIFNNLSEHCNKNKDFEENATVRGDGITDYDDMSANNNYWSNEIQVGVTKTNYVQKLRLKFEMFSTEPPAAITNSPAVSPPITEIFPKSNESRHNRFLHKFTTPRRKTCHNVSTSPSAWSYLGGHKDIKNSINNNDNNKNFITYDYCDNNDKFKLLCDFLPSEDEVAEISDCEEPVQLRQAIESSKEQSSCNKLSKKNSIKINRNKKKPKEDNLPKVTLCKISGNPEAAVNDCPQIVVDDFGEISVHTNDQNKKLNTNNVNESHNFQSKSEKVVKPEIKGRRGILRSMHRRKTDICEGKNIKCILPKSHSYHPDEFISSHLLDRDVGCNRSEIDEASPTSAQANTNIIDFTYGSHGILPMVEELIKTEEKYVESLREGIKNYGGVFTREDLPDGLKGKRYDLLGNVEEILEFHETAFLPMLKLNSNDLVTMFNAFTNLIEENEFYPYVIFVINKRNSIKLLDKYPSYFKELQKEIEDRLGINSFLIKPIQRLQRYPLPLQEFYKTQFGDISYKAAIAACCKLEKRLRDFITVVNESEAINDIEDCFDLNIYHQGRFVKADDFKIYDYSIRKLYPAKGFFFEKCIVYTEVKEKRLLYRGHYPFQKFGFLPNSKSTKFTLYYDKRKRQECDFEAEPNIIDMWTKLIQPIIEARLNEEIKKNEERQSLLTHSSLTPSSVTYRHFNFDDFQNASRISADSGIESMTPCQSIRTPSEGGGGEEGRMSTWYDTM